jgi:hypothetical protein
MLSTQRRMRPEISRFKIANEQNIIGRSLPIEPSKQSQLQQIVNSGSSNNNLNYDYYINRINGIIHNCK